MYLKELILDSLDFTQPIFCDTETLGFYGRTRLFQVRQGDISYEYDCFFVNTEDIKEAFNNAHLVFHNAHYDLNCIDFRKWLPKKLDDTLLMARLTWPTLPSFSLANLASIVGLEKGEEGNSDWHETILSEEQLKYSANDTLLVEKLYYELSDATELDVYQLDLKSLMFSCIYSHKGIPVDRKEVQRLKREQKSIITKAEKLLPKDLNVNSSLQVTQLLGTESGSFDNLVKLENNTTAFSILEKRGALKSIQYLERIEDFPMVYSIINPNGAVTGRFTAKGTNDLEPQYLNLQQIPGKLKSAFRSNYYVYADYPALEIWCAAALWGDEFQVECLVNREDLHKKTAATMFNKAVEDVTPQERTIAKTCNFSLQYGAGNNRFKEIFLTTGNKEAAERSTELRQKWLQVYKNISAYHTEVFNYFKNNNYKIAYTALKRPMMAKSPTEYLNFQIQGTGAEVTKISLLLLRKQGIVPNLTVHDSISFLATSYNEAQEKAEILAKCMEQGFAREIKDCKVNHLRLKVEAKVSEFYNG